MSERTLYLVKKPGLRLQLVKVSGVPFPYQVRKNRRILHTELDLVDALYKFRSEAYKVISQVEFDL